MWIIYIPGRIFIVSYHPLVIFISAFISFSAAMKPSLSTGEISRGILLFSIARSEKRTATLSTDKAEALNILSVLRSSDIRSIGYHFHLKNEHTPSKSPFMAYFTDIKASISNTAKKADIITPIIISPHNTGPSIQHATVKTTTAYTHQSTLDLKYI